MSRWVSDTKQYPTRAQRFEIPMPLHYRRRGEEEWREGTIQNISRTGVLFRVEELMEESTLVEMNFQLPEEVGGVNAAQILCAGRIVRTVLPAATDQPPALVAIIQSYRFIQKGGTPET